MQYVLGGTGKRSLPVLEMSCLWKIEMVQHWQTLLASATLFTAYCRLPTTHYSGTNDSITLIS